MNDYTNGLAIGRYYLLILLIVPILITTPSAFAEDVSITVDSKG